MPEWLMYDKFRRCYHLNHSKRHFAIMGMAEAQHSDRNENSFIIKQVSRNEAILCSYNKMIGGS